MSTGYRNLPAQTREMFIEDGWVRTGKLCSHLQILDIFFYSVFGAIHSHSLIFEQVYEAFLSI